MKVRFFASDKRIEKGVSLSFAAGVNRYGDTCDIAPSCADPDLTGIDVAAMVGVKSRKMHQACLEAGVVPVLCDKGYTRHRREDARVWEYWRLAIGEHQPTRFLSTGSYPGDRWDKLGLDVARWRKSGFQIVIAGASAKYHEFMGLPDPTEWATGVVRKLRGLTDRPIIYRPKPSWDGAIPIDGTHFSGPAESINSALSNAWVMITHSSNACFEAALAGIPTIVLGNAVVKPISSTSLSDVNDPMLGERGPWLKALAHWQWTEREMEKGRTWDFLRPKIEQWRRETWPSQ